jgi:hypothetical protein
MIRNGFLHHIAAVYAPVKTPASAPMAVRHALELITKTGIDQRMGHALEIADSRMITAVVAIQ